MVVAAGRALMLDHNRVTVKKISDHWYVLLRQAGTLFIRELPDWEYAQLTADSLVLNQGVGL